MTYSEMVGQLKSTIEEDGHSASAMVTLELIGLLQSGMKKPEPQLESLAKSLNSHIVAMAQHKWSVAKYFSGRGPIANKLRDYAVISRHFSMGIFKLEDKLKKFDFQPLTDDADRAKAFRSWLEDVAMNAFGTYHDIELPLPYNPGIEVGLPSGIHRTNPESYAAGTESPQWLVLAADLENGLKARYIVRRDHRALLLYWHPHEEVWLADPGETIFPGVLEAFAAEWEKLANKSGYTAEKPVDVEANLAELHTKMNQVFDAEEKLPDVTQHYVRNDDSMSSFVRLQVEQYILTFMNTKGQWASRNILLSVNGAGPYNMRVQWSDLREFTRQEIFKQAHLVLDGLIQQYINLPEEPPALPDASEQADTVAEVQAQLASETPDYTPVYLKLQRQAKKEK